VRQEVALQLLRRVPQSHHFGMRRRVDEFDNAAGALADYLAVENEDRSEGRLPLILQSAPGKLYCHAKVVFVSRRER
jgi:hypothetical protein